MKLVYWYDEDWFVSIDERPVTSPSAWFRVEFANVGETERLTYDVMHQDLALAGLMLIRGGWIVIPRIATLWCYRTHQRLLNA